jgi:hypothetical protein
MRQWEAVKPRIDATQFGSITIDGHRIDHDVVVRLDGTVEKRKKKLSKRVYGTSHRISLAEAKHVFEEGARLLIIGTGQHGLVRLDDQARAFLSQQGCDILPMPTPRAILVWNHAHGAVIGLFHVTC